MKLSDIKTRVDLVIFCESIGLTTMVEVGVGSGKFSKQILESTNRIVIHGVDPWLPYNEIPMDRGPDKDSSYQLQRRFPGRLVLHEATSVDYVQSIDYEPQLVFLDGSHHTEFVSQDLEMWWSKVSSPGILAGHDWDLDFSVDFSVKRPVIKFANSQNLTLHIIHEYGNGRDGVHPSYFMIKGNLEG